MSQTHVVDAPNLYFFLPLLLFPLLTIIFFINFFETQSQSVQMPPRPYPWPLVGNLFHISKNPHITLSNFAKTCGPLISLKLGTQLVVVASSSSSAIEILKTHDHVLSGRSIPQAIPIKESEINNISMGLALECSERWNFFRTICQADLFSSRALQAQEWIREKKVIEMVEHLGKKEGKVVHIGEMVFTCIFNMLTNILLSRDIFKLEDERGGDEGNKGIIRTAMETLATPNISYFYPILSGLDLQGLKRKSKEWSEKMNTIWAPSIAERRERGGSDLSRDFLDVLIENNLTDDCINQLLQV